MFTGIANEIGRVRAIRGTNRAVRIEIESALELSDAAIGASVLNNGCCMTVAAKGQGRFEVEATNETLARATVGDWVSTS
jgi:riboflavin synthase